jgi:hypothetical protein
MSEPSPKLGKTEVLLPGPDNAGACAHAGINRQAAAHVTSLAKGLRDNGNNFKLFPIL